MATLTMQIVSALGTSSKTLTFSGPDATRIFNAYKAKINQTGTQDDMVVWLSQQTQRLISQIVLDSETVSPTPPTMT